MGGKDTHAAVFLSARSRRCCRVQMFSYQNHQLLQLPWPSGSRGAGAFTATADKPPSGSQPSQRSSRSLRKLLCIGAGQRWRARPNGWKLLSAWCSFRLSYPPLSALKAPKTSLDGCIQPACPALG